MIHARYMMVYDTLDDKRFVVFFLVNIRIQVDT